MISFNDFSSLGGVIVSISASVESTIAYESGKNVAIRAAHQLSNLQLDPDFDAMNAFKLDAPKGTPAAFLDERGAAGLQYQWVDGAMAPAMDVAVFDKIEAQLSNAEGAIATIPETPDQELAQESVSLRTARAANARLVYMAAGLAVVSCLACVLYVRARRSGQ